MTQIDEPNLDKKLRTLFYYDPDELGEDAFKPLGDDEVEEITKLIATQVEQARGCVDCKKLRCENCERLWQT